MTRNQCLCGRLKKDTARTCRICYQRGRVGRPLGANALLAAEVGLPIAAIVRLGGAERLNAMAPEAKATLLGMVRRRA